MILFTRALARLFLTILRLHMHDRQQMHAIRIRMPAAKAEMAMYMMWVVIKSVNFDNKSLQVSPIDDGATVVDV